MKNYAHMIRYSISCLALVSALLISGAHVNVSAQEKSEESVAPAQVKIRGPRDPFIKYVPPPPKRKKITSVPTPVPVPTIQQRIEGYKAQKLDAMNNQQPAPKPTTALLLSEMQVTGIFRTPRGYAAMVEATPIKLSYVIYPGEMFYDGQLVAIEEDRLVFRHETRWTDGRVAKTVENKPLRQPNAISDSMAATKSAADKAAADKAATDSGTGAAAATPAMGEEKAPTPEKQ
jgi:hypothetical protein